MGQLERYGLYVLCVVIFLILGVALWGGDPVPPSTVVPAAMSRDLNATPGDGHGVADPAPPANTPPANPAPRAEEDAVAKLRRAFGTASETDKAARNNDNAPPLDSLAGVAPVPPAGTGRDERQAPAATTTEYVVKRGDTLEEIAEAHFGKGKKSAWQEIVKANPGLVPTKMQVGDKLRLPAKAVLDKGKEAPAPVAADEYVIKSGDNLESIALATLGKRTRWREIEAANPGIVASQLQPGARIKIPAKR